MRQRWRMREDAGRIAGVSFSNNKIHKRGGTGKIERTGGGTYLGVAGL